MENRPPKGDILHPLTSLEWRKCCRPPVNMSTHAQAVCLQDKLYVGSDKLYIYTPTTDLWEIENTPVCYFALVVYQSQVVLVGGRKTDGSRSVTNNLLTLDRRNNLREKIHPMEIKRQHASALSSSNRILVGGGCDDKWKPTDTVEVYNGRHWSKAESLPIAYYPMKSAILDEYWYLAGIDGQKSVIYYGSVESVVASCQPIGRRDVVPSVWKRLDNIPHDPSCLLVFGNRLVTIGSSLHRGILAYSPYSHSWGHITCNFCEMNDQLAIVNVAAALPAGDLMVVEYCSLYRVQLSVTSSSPDSQFTMEGLHQLEEFGLLNLEDLEKHKHELEDAIGLNVADQTRFSSLSLFEMWAQGHASLHPTWRNLFSTLRQIKLNELADDIEHYLFEMVRDEELSSNSEDPTLENGKSRRPEDNNKEEEAKQCIIRLSAEEEKHIAAVQQAMEDKGSLDHTIVHGVFVGPARSGKNSIMERLLGQMPSALSPSTGVAERVVQVKVMQRSTTVAANIIENKIWSPMDYDDEAVRLTMISTESRSQNVMSDIISEESTEHAETKVIPTDDDKEDTVSEAEVDKTLSSEPREEQSVQETAEPVGTSSIERSKAKSYEAIEIFKTALRNKGIDRLQQHFLKIWSLYLTNTGGQMEFQEVLPLLVSGPAIFFFIFRLDRDLNKPYAIEYDLADGTNAKPYTSTLSTLEGIHQTLATICAMGTIIYKGRQKREIPLRPKVFLIGTHKDRLKPKKARAHIANVDRQLQQAIRSTSHYEKLVEFAYPSQMIFTVDNFSKDESDFNDIRLAVDRVVIRDEFKMTSPAHWLIFSLALRKIKSPVITYKECMDIGKQCGISEDELDEALHFIHSKMGLIRYFSYDEIKHLIVIDPQHLFDKVTELIVSTFTFEKAGKQAMDAFKQKGIFSLIEFENINSKTKSGMKASEFAKLLEKLRIAAPFNLEGNTMYFVPCVLAHVSSSKQSKLYSAKVPPLIVTFQCGYCPKGLAGALISYLLANEMRSKFSWNLCHEEIFRNQVSFRVGPLDTVVLKIYSTHLKVKFIQGKLKPSNRRCTVGEVCSEVCKAIEAGIYQVTSDISYINAQHFLTFRCGCGGDHPAGVLEFVDGIPHNLLCKKKNKTFPLPKGYQLWQITQFIHQQFAKCSSTSSELPSERYVDSQHDHSLASDQYTLLEDNHHSILLKQLKNQSAKWKVIGLHLGFLNDELNCIEAMPSLYSSAPTSWLSEMLVKWLQWAPNDGRGSTSCATLESLKAALCDAELGHIANTLHI